MTFDEPNYQTRTAADYVMGISPEVARLTFGTTVKDNLLGRSDAIRSPGSALPKDLEYTEEQFKALHYADQYALRERIAIGIHNINPVDLDRAYKAGVSQIGKANYALEQLATAEGVDPRVVQYHEDEKADAVKRLNEETESYAAYKAKSEQYRAVKNNYDQWYREQRDAENAKLRAEKDAEQDA